MSNKNLKNALPPKTKLNKNKYEIVKALGAGGFGITYLVNGYVGNIKTRFAVKEFFISSLCERVGTEMKMSGPVRDQVSYSYKSFISEATRLNQADIHHPNIVGINEIFKQNNTAYYVMEYIHGKNIRQYIQEGYTFTEEKAKTIMAPIFQAVALLHANHIVHYDIKPDNILLSKDDDSDEYRPVLIDFGLSKHYNDQGEATSMIKYLAMSPGFAPNEQYLNNEMELFNPQADVYSLAATMLFMITGKNPEPAQMISPAKIAAALGDKASEQTCKAISQAMAPLRENRTLSVKDFAEELGIDINSDELSNTTLIPYNLEEDEEDSKKINIKKIGKFAAIIAAIIAAIVVVVTSALFIKEKMLNQSLNTQQTEPTKPDTLNNNGTKAVPVTAAASTDTPAKDADKPSSTSEKAIDREQSKPSEQTAKPSVQSDPTPQKTTENKPEPVSKKGSLSLSYGSYYGEIKNNKADGNGTVTFTVSKKFHGVQVEPGYKMNAVFDNGSLVAGEIYDDEGNYIQTVIP